MSTTEKTYVHGVYTPHPNRWGLIPSFLNADDPRPAWEQIDANYIGGWHTMKYLGLNLKDEYTMEVTYRGDEETPEAVEDSVSWLRFRDEMLYIDSHEVVVAIRDGKWEACRLD